MTVSLGLNDRRVLVVGPVLFLSSELSSFVTGQVRYVDGGRTLV